METTSLNIGNYYGDLTIYKDDSGKTSWAISGSEHDEEDIPEYLYDAIMRFHQECKAETEEYVKRLLEAGYKTGAITPGYIEASKGDAFIRIWPTRKAYEAGGREGGANNQMPGGSIDEMLSEIFKKIKSINPEL